MTPGAVAATPVFWRVPVPTGKGHCGFLRTVASGAVGRAAVRKGDVSEACMFGILFLWIRLHNGRSSVNRDSRRSDYRHDACWCP